MFKKLTLTILLFSTLVLTACQPSTQPDSSSSATSTSKSTSSSTSSSDPSEDGAAMSARATLTTDASDDNQNKLLSRAIEWDYFVVDGLKGEIDDGNLELDLDWTNKNDAAASFTELGKIQVFQDDQELTMLTEDNDDFNERVAPGKHEDGDVSFELLNTTSPIVIKLATKNGDEPHVINVDLN